MKECNLNNAGAVTAWKGDSGFSRSNNTMVFIPEFYVAAKRNGTKQYFYVSDKPKTGMTKHPGSGKYVDTLFPEVNPVLRLRKYHLHNRSSNAKKNGDKWHLYDFATYCAIIWLYLIEFADWNCQITIGAGVTKSEYSGCQKWNDGYDDISHRNSTAGSIECAVQYRWVENLLGNVSQWWTASTRTAQLLLHRPDGYETRTMTTGYTKIGTLPASG